MRLEWLPAASADRDAIYDYVSSDSRRAALQIDATIEQQVYRLVEHPLLGRPGRLAATRELIVVGTPYIVIYEATSDCILLIRVLHGAQSWPNDPH